jgi:hypothetical protein
MRENRKEEVKLKSYLVEFSTGILLNGCPFPVRRP